MAKVGSALGAFNKKAHKSSCVSRSSCNFLRVGVTCDHSMDIGEGFSCKFLEIDVSK